MTWFKGSDPVLGQAAYSKIEPTGFTIKTNPEDTFTIHVQPGDFRIAEFATQAQAEEALEGFMSSLGFEQIPDNT